MASFASASKPEPRPDKPDSPKVSTGQEIFQEKKGVFVGGFAPHERLARKMTQPESPTFSPDHNSRTRVKQFYLTTKEEHVHPI